MSKFLSQGSQSSGRAQQVFNWLSLGLLLEYVRRLWIDLSPYWFNPLWTTDDALQQIYPFHKVLNPELFKGDLITEVMEGYLAPLHYWISWGLTWLTGDPIMMSHWLTLIQIGLAALFIFLTLKHVTNWGVACLGVLWLLHTRALFQRMVGGLPRCWASAIVAATIYFMVKRNHKAVLVVLLLGCLLNPPATLVAAATYGLFLTIAVLLPKTRKEFLKPFLTLVLLSPVYAGSVLLVIKRSPEVGQMVTFDEASKMPEFQRPSGRFPFLPLDTRTYEYRIYGYQPFKHRLFDVDSYIIKELGWKFWPREFFKIVTFPIIILVGLCLLFKEARQRRWIAPAEVLSCLAAIIIVYELSRLLAFQLYVPNRHLQAPLSVFWLIAFPIAIQRAFQNFWPRVLAFLALAAFVIVLSGHGFYGTANYNYSRYKKGKVFEWIRKNTAQDALIAGHPTHIDALMLFGERTAFATTETAHPFYTQYFKEIKRRLELSLRAHYAQDLKTVVDLLQPEGVDYFVFNRMRFYPDALAREKFFEPLHGLVRELASKPPSRMPLSSYRNK
jgi:hypothetical protein